MDVNKFLCKNIRRAYDAFWEFFRDYNVWRHLRRHLVSLIDACKYRYEGSLQRSLPNIGVSKLGKASLLAVPWYLIPCRFRWGLLMRGLQPWLSAARSGWFNWTNGVIHLRSPEFTMHELLVNINHCRNDSHGDCRRISAATRSCQALPSTGGLWFRRGNQSF